MQYSLHVFDRRCSPSEFARKLVRGSRVLSCVLDRGPRSWKSFEDLTSGSRGEVRQTTHPSASVLHFLCSNSVHVDLKSGDGLTLS